VLLKYKLLEWRNQDLAKVNQWISNTPVLESIRQQMNLGVEEFQDWLVQALVKSKAAAIDRDMLVNLD
jgi:hypothetical protein